MLQFDAETVRTPEHVQKGNDITNRRGLRSRALAAAGRFCFVLTHFVIAGNKV